MNNQVCCSGRILPENVCPVYGDDHPNCEKCDFHKNYLGGNTMKKQSYKKCILYDWVLDDEDTCTPTEECFNFFNCEECPCYDKNKGGKTMEKLSRSILTINVRDNTVNYKDVLPIIQRLAEYEASEMTPEEVKSLTQDFKALKRDLKKREEELLDCRETIVYLRENLESQQKSCDDTEVIEITPQDHIRLAVEKLFRDIEQMRKAGEK